MKSLMRKLAAVICMFTLAACGRSEPAAPAAPMPTDPAAQVRVVLQTSPMSHDWISIARQRDCREVGEINDPGGERCAYGEVYYNQRTITRSVDGTVANVWAEVRHGVPQLIMGETDTTITRIRYTQSRIHYRLRCTDETFAIIEQQVLGDSGAVVHRRNPPEIYRAPVRWTAVALLFPPACRGGTLVP